jgi:hypothetical protein
MELSIGKAEKVQKQLNDEARLLASRIKLLENEERRTWRRISETKRRVEQLAKSKQSLEAKHQARQALLDRRNQQVNHLREEHMRIREQRRQDQTQIFFSLSSYKRREADQVRAFKEELGKKVKEHEINQRLRSSQQARAIKFSTIRAHKSAEMRRYKRPAQTEQSVLVKECEIRAKEIAELEREEKELIKRLQFTQTVQEQAYGELQEVMS